MANRESEAVPISQVRSAHPTRDLSRIREFYGKTLGLPEIGAFDDHDGYSGVMFGCPDRTFHLEFTRCDDAEAMPSWSAETLLVLYVPEKAEHDRMLSSLVSSGAVPVRSQNPYWDRRGATFLDPDGRRVVIF